MYDFGVERSKVRVRVNDYYTYVNAHLTNNSNMASVRALCVHSGYY